MRPFLGLFLATLLALAPSPPSDGFHFPHTSVFRGASLCTVGVAKPQSRSHRRLRLASSTVSLETSAAATDDEPEATEPTSSSRDALSHPSISGRWRTMFRRLQDYHAAHGHCRVPKLYDADRPLGAWVAYQRRLRRRKLRGLPARAGAAGNPLTDERVAALDALNFTWDLRDHAWRTRLGRLRRFREEHGHCRVPSDHADRGLAVFAMNQRRQYANYVAGRGSTLSPDRVEALRDAGFHFGTNRTDLWRRRYEELVEFRNEHGHALVPEKYGANPSLGCWVANQRVRYRNSLSGGSPSLSRDRIEALERIDFRWDAREHGWSAMFDRLKTYLEQVGNFHVLPDDEENRDLRTWIRVQRYHRAMRERGLPSPLTDRRIEELDGIGFEWMPRRGPKRKRTDEEGPSTDDWSKLFEEMKDRGIDSKAEVKEHWFAGGRSFEEEEKEMKEWAEADVMDLWEQGDDEDDW